MSEEQGTPPPASRPETMMARMAADLRLLRQALADQGKTLGELAAQVARLTRRQDDSDATHIEIEDKMAIAIDGLASSQTRTNLRIDLMSKRLDEIFVALTRLAHTDNGD